MNLTGPQTAELPADYLNVMLPVLLEEGQLDTDAHRQVLDVLGEKGFQPAVSMLTMLLATTTFKGSL